MSAFEWVGVMALVIAAPFVVLIAIAHLLAGFKWVIEEPEDVLDFIGEHWAAFLGFGVAAALIIGVAVTTWPERKRPMAVQDAAKREPVSELMQEAERMFAEIESKDAAWKAEMDNITTLIVEMRPEKFDLVKETATAEALRGYVERLRRLGESGVKSLGRMKETAEKLDPLLEKAPGLCRKLGKQQRDYAEKEVWEDIKAKYLVVADLQEARAKAAELHRRDVRESLKGDLESYMRAQNLFLERLLTSLDNGLGGSELRDLAEFRKAIEEILAKHDFLRQTLEAWRARMMAEPEVKPSSRKLVKATAPEAEAKEPRRDDDKRL